MTPETQKRGPPSVASALIIDDHPLFCDALSMTLKTVIGVTTIRIVGKLEDALTALRDGAAPDIVLLDLNLPDVTGLDGLVRLKNAVGATPVIVVSSMADERIVSLAFSAGAAGFVPKHSQADVFRAAFDAVANGEVYNPHASAATNPPEQTEEDAVRRLSSLTLQQARILNLVCEGRLNKQIAHDLSIAETTVKAHMTAILRKLGVHSRTQAVLIAQEANFAKLLQDSASSA